MSSKEQFRHPHFRQLAHLLVLESEAERDKLQQDLQRISPRDAEKSGNSLINLTIRDEASGLGGYLLLTLGKRNQQQDLPWSRLRVGTPVQLTSESAPSQSVWRGVVSRLRRANIEVALPHWPDDLDDSDVFRLDLASDEISRQRQQDALVQVDKAKDNRLAEFRSLVTGESVASFASLNAPAPFNTFLNSEQWTAVLHALAARDVAIIHGPPGTGKTTAVIELIRQAVRRGERVLASAPSNLAVDNILEGLLAAPELVAAGRVVRLGHPARILPQLREHTLEALVSNHPDMSVVRKLHKEAMALRNQAGKWSRARPERGARQELRREANAMTKDARRVERQLVERVLDGALVVCATTSGLDRRLLGERTFDLCVIDEAAQCTEPDSWVPLLYSQRLVLAGDHCQLPPTIISRQAAEQGLSISMMEKLMSIDLTQFAIDNKERQIGYQLIAQYRMHEQIMQFSSLEFYNGSLTADGTVRGHLLCDVPGVANMELTAKPIHFIDTAGADFGEEVEPDGESRFNAHEANLVQLKLGQLLEAGVPERDVAVISPYSAQVRWLRELLGNEVEAGVEIDSIDGFQGREKEAIIISLVRSNEDAQIGFLSDTRRMNVALTRARRKLIVIGDSATIGGDPFYARLLNYFEQVDAYRTVWEEDIVSSTG